MTPCPNLVLLRADVGHEIRFMPRRKFAGWLARQKYRYDLGASFLQIVTFGMLVAAERNNLAQLFGMRPLVMLAILVPSAVLAVWLWGVMLDAVGFSRSYQHEQNERNAMLQKAAAGR